MNDVQYDTHCCICLSWPLELRSLLFGKNIGSWITYFQWMHLSIMLMAQLFLPIIKEVPPIQFLLEIPYPNPVNPTQPKR